MAYGFNHLAFMQGYHIKTISWLVDFFHHVWKRDTTLKVCLDLAVLVLLNSNRFLSPTRLW